MIYNIIIQTLLILSRRQGGPEEGGPCQGEKKDRWTEEEGEKRKIPERGSSKEDEGDGGRELSPQEEVGWVERQVIYEWYIKISPSWNISSWMPICGPQIKVDAEQIIYKFYKKSVSNKHTMM